MPGTEIAIPQLGEGLQEARLIRFLKQPGDAVSRDEPIFEMETDKAVMEIESPSAGFLDEWLAEEGDVLPIGSIVGRIRENDLALAVVRSNITDIPLVERSPLQENGFQSITHPITHLQEALHPRNLHISPRERKYAHEKNISDEQIMTLYRNLGRRVERYDLDIQLPSNGSHQEEGEHMGFKDVSASPRQRTLIYRLQRGVSQTIPATLESCIHWDVLEQIRKRWKPSATIRRPSRFLLFAWCVVQSSKNYPKLRSALLNENTFREYDHLHLGVAVSMPDDELVMARVPDSDTMDFETFYQLAELAMKRAKAGEDQTGDAMQLSLTNLSHTGIRFAIPVVISPAVATLFLGAPFEEAYSTEGGGYAFRKTANMVLTFDHRLINGVGGARFLSDIKRRVDKLPDEFRDRLL